MIKKTYLLILVMLFAAPGLLAQTPTVTIGDVQAGAGEIHVPVYMENFEDMAFIDLAIDIDTQVLEFIGIANLADETPGASANFDGDAIKIGWFDTEGDGVDLDGKLLDLRLEYTGGFETTLSFIEDECEIGNAFFAIFEDVEYVSGTVTQDPDIVDGHVSMTTIEADAGDNVHMPITFEGDGFDSVGAFELFIEVDPDQIDYGDVVAQSGLFGMSAAEVEDGLIKITWQVMDDEDFSDETHVANLIVTYKGGGPAHLRFTGESRVTSGVGNYLSVHYNDGMVILEDTDARLNITDQVYQKVYVEDEEMDDRPVYEVPVTAESITHDVYAINISIAFDHEQVEYEDVEFAQLEGWGVTATESSVDFTWSHEDGASIDDGDLFVLHFVLPEDAEQAQSDITFRGGTNLLDEAANFIPVALDHGSITITELEYYTVTFNVVDEDDEPIEDAIVTFNDVTNEAGDYVFEDVMTGTYEYAVEKEGFVTFEGEVEVDDDTTVNVVLEEEEPDFIEVETIAELREMPDDGTVYLYTGEAVITAMDDFRNRKFIQDETAAILIDDNDGVITTEYVLYDVITNVMGQIDDWFGMIRFQPEENTEEALDNTPIDPEVFMLDAVTMDDQSKLLMFESVTFTHVDEGSNDDYDWAPLEAGDEFENGTNYLVTDGDNEFIVRTDFWNVDFIGEEIPHGEVHISGVVIYDWGQLKIVPRFADDIEEEIVETFEVTFFADLSLAIEYELLDGFDPEQHHIMMTGEMFGWEEPFAENEDQVLEKVDDDPLTYAITLHLEAGTYPYKYFSDLLGEGWGGGEWDGGDDRMVEVTGDMEVYDYFGYTDDELSAVDINAVEMNIYPVPARTNVTIESNTDISDLRVVDMLGQVVYSTAVNGIRHDINVSGFKNGVYFLQMTTTAGVITHRIQVAK